MRKTLSAARTQDAGDHDRLTRDLAKIDQGIEWVPDLIEQGGDPSLLLSRLEVRQAEQTALRRQRQDLGPGPEAGCLSQAPRS